MKRFRGCLAVVLTVLLIIFVMPMNAFAIFPMWSTGGEELSVSALVVDDCYVYENIDGYTQDIYDEETGEYIGEYFYYNYSPTFRVSTLNDGFFEASLINEDLYGIVYNGITYQLSFEDTQMDEPWGVGTHTVSATLLDKTVEFNVHVLESPVEKVEFNNTTVYENFNCYLDYIYDYETDEYTEFLAYVYEASCKVYFKDGTVCESVNGAVNYNGKDYFIEKLDMQYVSPWGKGKNEALVSLFGFEQIITVEVLENPYTSVTIDNDLNIALTRNDGVVEKYEFIDVLPEIYTDETIMIGTVYTDKGTIPGVTLYYGLDMDSPVSISFGYLLSNEVECKEFSATFSMAYAIATIKEYRVYSKYILQDTFMGYDSKDSETDALSLATIAVTSNMGAYSEFTDFVEGDGMYIVTVPVSVVKDSVQKLFGIGNFDATELDGYNAATQTVDLPLIMDILAIKDGDFESIENGYYGNIELYDAYTKDYDSIKVSCNNNGHIEKIEFVGDVAGLAIEKIEIVTPPEKTHYRINELSDPIKSCEGISFNVVYADGTKKLCNSMFTLGEFDCIQRGAYNVEVCYLGEVTGKYSDYITLKVVSGDVNGDGSENVSDLADVKKIIAGLKTIENNDLADIDLSGGSVNVADLAMLKKIIAGIEL